MFFRNNFTTRLFNNDYFHHGMMDGFFKYNSWSWGYCALMGLGLLLLIVAVILIVRSTRRKSQNSFKAIEILKTKYALGEITQEEFEQRKSVLEKK